ncbi:MFS family transporter [Methylobacterium isbiliense]|jgi:MHS family alpha-ketoglutarate permease-like MFS transporter|uniref:Alpha-ketoglutarate permease n=1 Tax=Methylobacterium isbiliense TaxID=315478 RepID=A0ABQ4SHG3_9HYPH|nr:MFS family transporter [Methylobacterium isbiliense]MDN3624158.1 MFS family transporter [Methylobacterium isbiliense]GJE01328.1 Alpha-ketoglutarate permease [Methylobacterium isbiliense]
MNRPIPAAHDALASQNPTIAAYDNRARIRAIIGSSSGNLVEWYDFYAYAFTAIYFKDAFFPGADPTVQLINTAAVFAIGFLMRPIGGWVFGRVADRYGRKTSMLISVMMMCAGSLVIAILPTYGQIGLLAPVLLLFARMAQGLSVGGEYGTSATYMSEVALKGRRGFYGSFQYVTLIGGQLLASLVVVLVTMALSDQEMSAWGWRIPFFIGAGAAVVALYLRRSLHETTTEGARASKEAGSMLAIWRHHRRAFLTVLGYTAGGSLIFYTFTTYMQKYLVNTAHMDKKTANLTMTAVLFTYMVVQPLFGLFADRFGRKTAMLIFGASTTLLTVPLLHAIGGTTNPVLAYGLITAALLCVSFYTSISGLVKAEMFPAEVRALGVGLSYAIANALFGGSAEFVALSFKDWGVETWFFWYVTAMCLIAFLTSLQMPDSRRSGYLQGDGTA